MALTLNGDPCVECARREFKSSMEMMLSRLSEVELQQVMLGLSKGYIGGKEEINALWYKDVFSIDEEGRTVIKIPAHLLGPRVKASCRENLCRRQQVKLLC